MGRPGGLSVYRGCTPVVDAEYSTERDESPAAAIAEAVATAAGVDATELPPLYEHVDLDAVDTLFGRRDSATDAGAVLGFEFDTWNVFVRGDGRIRVCDATRPTAPEPVFGPSSA